MVENQFSTTIKTLRSNGGGEYIFKAVTSYLASHGIAHQISCPYTPQQNDLMERKHRHLKETTITLLSQASLPSQYWSFAIQTNVSRINLLPTATFGFLSPWYKLYGHHTDLTHLKVVGCACYPLLRPYTHHKLVNITKECLFLGYSIVSKRYLCLDLTTNHLYTSRHGLFNETKFPFPSFPSSNSKPSISQPSHDTWLSNLLYLHSTNQPSVLGPYMPSASSHTDTLLPISSTPMPQVQHDPSITPPSPIPHTDAAFAHSSNLAIPPIQPPSSTLSQTIPTNHIPISQAIAIDDFVPT